MKPVATKQNKRLKDYKPIRLTGEDESMTFDNPLDATKWLIDNEYCFSVTGVIGVVNAANRNTTPNGYKTKQTAYGFITEWAK